MAAPATNGYGASTSGAALATVRVVDAPNSHAFPVLGDGPSSLGIGLLAAILLLAYWYRRVL